MASFTHLVKSLLLPLLTAAILYILLAHLILPFLRRNRSRYTNYLPLTMPDLSSTTPSSASWRTRVTTSLLNLFAPSYAQRHAHLARYRSASMTSEELFDDEEGEGMVGFDPIDERRREALEQRRSLMIREEEETRLGRELEEGFRDESSDEEADTGDERRRSLSRGRIVAY